jgi:uncharacterized protein (DUF2141 family)
MLLNIQRYIQQLLMVVALLGLTFVATAQETVRVSGTIYSDTNANGVQDADEVGLSDVWVTYIGEGTLTSGVARTDTEGNFAFEVDELNHHVNVDIGSLPFFGRVSSAVETYTLRASAGSTIVNVNFGIEEVPPSTIAGTVYEDRNGDGKQDPEEPGIADVDLIVVNNHLRDELSTVTTDADGTYQFQASAIDHTIFVDTSSLPFVGALTTDSSSFRYKLRTGTTLLGVKFGYRDVTPASISGFVFEDSNENGVQDEDEKGIAGVRVRLNAQRETPFTFGFSNDLMQALADAASGEVFTDDEGRYQFDAAPITYNVSVDTLTLPFFGRLTTGTDAYTLSLTDGLLVEDIGFGYVASEPSRISGTVFEDTNGDGVRDADERGIVGATVTIRILNTSIEVDLVTGANGAFTYDSTYEHVSVRVDLDTVLSANPIATTSSAIIIRVRAGFMTEGLDFGYREGTPDDLPIEVPIPMEDDTTNDDADDPVDEDDADTNSESNRYDDGTMQFTYPAGWVARPAVMSGVPGIAVAPSEEAIATLEAGDFAVPDGEVVITIQTLAAIAANNQFDIVADAGSASNAPIMYADELAESGYAVFPAESITLGDNTVTRAGATIFSFDQRIYGWEPFVIYATSNAGTMPDFQPIVESIITTMRYVGN